MSTRRYIYGTRRPMVAHAPHMAHPETAQSARSWRWRRRPGRHPSALFDMVPKRRIPEGERRTARCRRTVTRAPPGRNPTVHTGERAGSANVNADNMFNAPDGIAFDSQGRLWIQTDGKYSDEGDFAGQGNNTMLVGDPASGAIRRFLVGPAGVRGHRDRLERRPHDALRRHPAPRREGRQPLPRRRRGHAPLRRGGDHPRRRRHHRLSAAGPPRPVAVDRRGRGAIIGQTGLADESRGRVRADEPRGAEGASVPETLRQQGPRGMRLWKAGGGRNAASPTG